MKQDVKLPDINSFPEIERKEMQKAIIDIGLFAIKNDQLLKTQGRYEAFMRDIKKLEEGRDGEFTSLGKINAKT